MTNFYHHLVFWCGSSTATHRIATRTTAKSIRTMTKNENSHWRNACGSAWRVWHLREVVKRQRTCLVDSSPQPGGFSGKSWKSSSVEYQIQIRNILLRFIIIASYTANLAAFLTVSRLDTPIESLDDLAKQYKTLYAPLNGSSAMTYFQRMANIEHRFYEIWKDMSLNDSLSPVERSKLAVWDYPVSDKYTKMWQAMQETKLPPTLDAAVKKVRWDKWDGETLAVSAILESFLSN